MEKFSTKSLWATIYSPISRAVSSGFLRLIFNNGKMTSVMLPSNSGLVFCT